FSRRGGANGAVFDLLSFLGGPRIPQNFTRRDRVAFGILNSAANRLSRPKFHALEEWAVTQLFVLEDHLEAVAEMLLRRVLRMFDIQLDVEIPLGALLRRHRELVLAVLFGLVFGFFDDLVLGLDLWIAVE